MSDLLTHPCTAFRGHTLLLSGPLVEVALAVKSAGDAAPAAPLLVFDDRTGRIVDLDLRGSKAEVIQRLAVPAPAAPGRYRAAPPASAPAPTPAPDDDPATPKGRGRPKLGVVAREVTLLPRHWDWLSAQPSGASATLRKLVDAARKTGGNAHERRAALEAAYQFMLAMAGDLPGYEEATRALFADDRAALAERMAHWPWDVRDHALRLADRDSDCPQP